MKIRLRLLSPYGGKAFGFSLRRKVLNSKIPKERNPCHGQGRKI
jgi:hypothetical protein